MGATRNALDRNALIPDKMCHCPRTSTPLDSPILKTRLPWLCKPIGYAFLRLFGWRIEGHIPGTVPKAVFIASPHTSNWDGVVMVAIAWALRVRLSFLVKKETFLFGFGWLIRFFGGIAVDRSKSTNMVQRAVELFDSTSGMYLAVPPAGTRAKRDHWKSGFYHIARGAKVPVLCGFIDFKRRVGGVGPTVELTGDLKVDMDRFREIYAPIQGKHLERTTTVCLREEEAAKREAA